MKKHTLDYIPIDYFCTHCGGKLSAKYDPNVYMTIDGCDPLTYIHTKTLAPACPPKHTMAEPYSAWVATSEYRKAKEASGKVKGYYVD